MNKAGMRVVEVAKRNTKRSGLKEFLLNLKDVSELLVKKEEG